MTSSSGSAPVLTLEPLVEAVREGVEEAGWELSGLQKTTSHQFEGRWEGESTRSAYVFFHRPDRWEGVSIDVYLDETSRGLKGNLALVVDGRPFGELDDVEAALAVLGAAAHEHLPEGYRTPVTFRLRLSDSDVEPAQASLEIRFKLHIPRTAIDAGASAVSALASTAARAFEALAVDRGIQPYVVLE